MDTDDRFYCTTSEAARLLHVSPETVRRLCSRGQIECIRRRRPGQPQENSRYLIPRTVVLGMLADQKVTPDLRPVPRRPVSEATRRVLARFGIRLP